nr:hypothetical protein [Tanacetum cinerariifolium]
MSNDRVFCRPCTCERCRRNYTDRFCAICYFESGNAFIDDLITNSFDDLSNSSDHPPQHQTHSFESNGDPPQISFISNPDFDNFSQTSLFDQFHCHECEDLVEGDFRCQQCIFKRRGSGLIKGICFICASRTENSSNAITTSPPVLPIEDPVVSLIMGNEELNTILEKESDKFITSSVEDLVPIPSESEDTSGSNSVKVVKKVAKSDLDSDSSIRLRFVLGCVLSSTAFCLSEDLLLRFAKDKLYQTQNCTAFCLRLRFASEVLRFDLAFCYRRSYDLL